MIFGIEKKIFRQQPHQHSQCFDFVKRKLLEFLALLYYTHLNARSGSVFVKESLICRACIVRLVRRFPSV